MLATLATLVLLTPPADGSAAVQVQLLATAVARGTSLELDEVAELSGDPHLVELVGDALLGYAPSPGHARVLDAQAVTAQLEREHVGVSFHVGGASACRVVVESEEVEGRAAWEVARRTLLERSPAGIVLTPVGQLPPIVVPRGETPARLEARIEPETTSSREWRVPVRVWVEEELYRTVWTRWRAERVTEVPVLTRAIARGEAVRREDLRFESVRVPASGAERALDVHSLRGAVARRDLPLGTQLNEQHLDRPYVIERGDVVSLEVRRGAIVARTRVESLQRARLGDRIRVRSQSSGRELVGRVVSRELVLLALEERAPSQSNH